MWRMGEVDEEKEGIGVVVAWTGQCGGSGEMNASRGHPQGGEERK